AAELVPLSNECALRVEDLDAVVATVPKKQSAARIHCKRMRAVDLAGSRTFFPPGLDEFAVLGKLHDARIGISAVPVGNENIAVALHEDRRRRVKHIGAVARHAGLAERHQQSALRTEFHDGVALRAATDAVRRPDISLVIDMQAVRKYEQAFAKRFYQLAGGIKLQDWVEVHAVA